MNTIGVCKFRGTLGNNDHIFRYCSRATMVWNFDPFNLLIDNFANVDFKAYMDGNVRSAQFGEKKLTANVFFILKLWTMWKARNKFEFDNNIMSLEVVLRESNNFAWSIKY